MARYTFGTDCFWTELLCWAGILLQGLTLASSHFCAGEDCTGMLQKLEKIEFQVLGQNDRTLNLWRLLSKLDSKRWFKRRFISLCKQWFFSVTEFESSVDPLLKLTDVIRNIVFKSYHFHISLKNILCSYKIIFIFSSNSSKYWSFWCTTFLYIIEKLLIFPNVDLWLSMQSGIQQAFTGH